MTSLLFIVLQTPLPIAIKELPQGQPDIWLIGGTVASAVVAVFTGYLALQTKRLADRTTTLSEQTRDMASATIDLARETRETIAVAQAEATATERHHQESLSPVVVLKSPRVIYQGLHREFGHLLDFRADQVVNIGFGPALRINYEVRVSRTAISGTSLSPAGSLDRGSFAGPEVVQFKISQTNDDRPVNGAVDAEILVTYANVFNEYRVTKYELKKLPDQTFECVETIFAQSIAPRRRPRNSAISPAGSTSNVNGQHAADETA